ncbi:MAG: hypothetical protein ACM3ON_10600 [Chloroflexota bacterium]
MSESTTEIIVYAMEGEIRVEAITEGTAVDKAAQLKLDAGQYGVVRGTVLKGFGAPIELDKLAADLKRQGREGLIVARLSPSDAKLMVYQTSIRDFEIEKASLGLHTYEYVLIDGEIVKHVW